MPKPHIITAAAAINEYSQRARRDGLPVGFVPTMGALHDGHLSLMQRARTENDRVIVSIFVNPAQFGPNEDFNSYDLDLDGDVEKCDTMGVDAVFAPPTEEIYTPDACTYVDQTALTDTLCGASRPGHFRGVLTVVAKLFNIIAPHNAYFGQKDYQQFVVLKKMVADLNIPVEMKMCSIVREPDGLAMSSRNAYLSRHERRDALCLFNALSAARARFDDGERNASILCTLMREHVQSVPSTEIDYVAIVHPETLQQLDTIEGSAVAALAVQMGKARLIDNMILGTE